jgi:hypothetical protein
LAGQRIVAVGLLTERELKLLGEGFTRVWPIDDTPCFGGLLQAIDEADRAFWRERDQAAPKAKREPHES